MRGLGLSAVVLVIAACSVEVMPSTPPVSPGQTGPAVPLATPALAPPPVGSGDAAAGLPYGCTGNPFDLGILSRPAVADLGDDAAAAALREQTRHLDGAKRGWWLTYRSATEAEFLAINGPDLFDYFRFRLRDDGTWELRGAGDCALRFVAEGRSTLSWRIDESAPPDADTRIVRVLVSEQYGSVDLLTLQPPIIRLTDEVVLIVFTANQPAGLNADPTLARAARSRTASARDPGRLSEVPLFDHCSQGPPVPVEVDLGEPLGERRLVDGATWPARDARQPVEP